MNINATNEHMKTCVLTTLIVINSDEQVNKQKNTSKRIAAQNVQQYFKKSIFRQNIYRNKSVADLKL